MHVRGAGIHDLGLFMAAVLVLNATPGVDMVLAAGNTLRHGLRGGFATALGASAGCVAHTLAAAFGLAALLGASPGAFQALKWAGAAWLVWVAFGLLRSARSADAGTAAGVGVAPATAPGRLALFRQGFVTNVLNPKIALFFLALLPQFIDADAADKTLAFLVLGAVMVAQGAAFLALFVAVVARFRRRDPAPALRRGIHGAAGVLMLGLAARLAFTEST